VLNDLGEVVAARGMAERALATIEGTLGPTHRMTIESRRLVDRIAADLERRPPGGLGDE
jgi:hypothetical protein